MACRAWTACLLNQSQPIFKANIFSTPLWLPPLQSHPGPSLASLFAAAPVGPRAPMPLLPTALHRQLQQLQQRAAPQPPAHPPVAAQFPLPQLPPHSQPPFGGLDPRHLEFILQQAMQAQQAQKNVYRPLPRPNGTAPGPQQAQGGAMCWGSAPVQRRALAPLAAKPPLVSKQVLLQQQVQQAAQQRPVRLPQQRQAPAAELPAPQPPPQQRRQRQPPPQPQPQQMQEAPAPPLQLRWQRSASPVREGHATPEAPLASPTTDADAIAAASALKALMGGLPLDPSPKPQAMPLQRQSSAGGRRGDGALLAPLQQGRGSGRALEEGADRGSPSYTARRRKSEPHKLPWASLAVEAAAPRGAGRGGRGSAAQHTLSLGERACAACYEWLPVVAAAPIQHTLLPFTWCLVTIINPPF